MNLKIVGLTKSFKNTRIFDNFSYSFESSGLYVVSAKSGAGKTTFLRIICGLDKEYSGKVIKKDGCRVSMVFQEYRLFPTLSALENITMLYESVPDIDIKAKEMLSRLGFKDEEMELRPVELSGGMKQRVSLARALLSDADILLLDEPTKELDKELSDLVYSLISDFAEHSLVILVTHENLPEALQIKDTIKLESLH